MKVVDDVQMSTPLNVISTLLLPNIEGQQINVCSLYAPTTL